MTVAAEALTGAYVQPFPLVKVSCASFVKACPPVKRRLGLA